ncbi:MAG: hypothetical protein R6U52_01540 [Kosmotogaceae bacterium]
MSIIHLKYGSGLGKGLSSFGQAVGEALQKRAEKTQLEKILNPSPTQQAQNITEDEGFRQNFLDMIQSYENETGKMLTPDQIDVAWNSSVNQANAQQGAQQPQGQYNMQQLSAIAQKNPQLASMIQQNQLAQQKSSLQEKKLDFQQKLAYQKMNEPLVQKLNERLQKTQQTGYDFERLNNIFTEDANKLPSAWTAAMIDLEGPSGLSKLARTQITPEAQEVIKIIVNQLRGARETFGARVTNFEADKYLLGLPGLLNSPEGRKAILRDLRIVNKINELHDKGILDAFNSGGGTSNITYSEAARIAKEKNKPQIEQLREMYANPKKRDFSSVPDASLLKGEKLIDESTGQEFVSNGMEWIPIRGE